MASKAQAESINDKRSHSLTCLYFFHCRMLDLDRYSDSRVDGGYDISGLASLILRPHLLSLVVLPHTASNANRVEQLKIGTGQQE